jgi:hypothetical protein
LRIVAATRRPRDCRGFSCALLCSCESPRRPACADCAVFCAALSVGSWATASAAGSSPFRPQTPIKPKTRQTIPNRRCRPTLIRCGSIRAQRHHMLE